MTTDKFIGAQTGAPSRYFWKYLAFMSINLHRRSSHTIGELVTCTMNCGVDTTDVRLCLYTRALSVTLIIGFEILHLHSRTNSDKYRVGVRT